MNNYRYAPIAMGLIASLYATTAMAQSTPAPVVAPSEDANADDGGLNDIVVVAQKKAERLGDVPVSVGVVQGESLARLNLASFEQMSRYVPTFNVAETASGNRITLRGISSGTNRGFEQSVGLFVDGIYAGRAAQFTSPFFDVERIEVLKGPQSILFGKNTVAGAVSIITARPTDRSELTFSGGYEMRFGGFNASAVANQPITDNLQLRVAVRHDQRHNGVMRNSLKDAREPTKNNDVARVSLGWQPGAGIEVNAKYEYSESERVGSIFQIVEPGTFGGLFKSYDPKFESDLDLNNSVGGPDSDRNAIRAHNAALRVTIPIGNAILTSDTGYSKYKVSADLEDSDFTAVPVLQFNNRENFSQFSQELRFASPSSDRIAYTLGAFYQTNHYISRPEFIVTGAGLGLFNTDTRRIFDQRTETYSGFGELSFELVDGLRIIGGGRYINESKKVSRELTVFNPVTGLPETDAAMLARVRAALAMQNFSLDQSLKERQFTPAVTLQYKVDSGTMVYAKYSRGFKSGGFDASDAMGSAVPYRSESVDGYEAGLKWSPDRKFNLNLSAFYSRFSDLQSQAYNGVAFITTNAAKASSRGVEAEVRWRPISPLTLSGSIAYLDAHYDSYPGASCTTGQNAAYKAAGGTGTCTQDLSGRPLTDSSRWSASLNASYEIDIAGDWNARFDVGTNIRSSAYVAPDLDPIGLQKGYGTVDTSLELFAPNDRMTIALLGKNIFDVRAMTYLVNVPLFTGAKGASINEPRTVEVRATMRF